jgi:OOP family OmpA-OmpF porin
VFQQLVHDTASQLNLPVSGVASLLRSIVLLLTNEQAGGLDGFLETFRRVGLGSAIEPWIRGRSAIGVTGPQLETALGPTLLDKFSDASGLSRGAVLSALTLLLPKVVGRLRADGLTALKIHRTAAPPAGTRASALFADAGYSGMAWQKWVPWLAAAALVLATLAWLPLPSRADEAQLTLRNENGRILYTGTMPDTASRNAIVAALHDGFGDRMEGSLLIDAHVDHPAWLPRIHDLIATLKTPGAEMSLAGATVQLGGWLSAPDAQTLNTSVHRILGTSVAFAPVEDIAAETVRAANDKAVSTLAAVGTSGVSTDRLVEAMSAAIINFKSGSADIPADARMVIKKSAEAIAQAPADTAIEIEGHTDNTGDPVGNMTLSQARADAVKAALVAAGAPAARLVARGYGDTQPRASNDTEYGRFQNRRIEYRVVSGTPP